MFKKALALHHKGRLADAAALYRRILRKDPKNADALHLLGVIETQRKNPRAAIALFDRAIELNPGNPAFFNNRGTARKNLNRSEEALADFGHALAMKPDYAEALNNRGVLLGDLERFDASLASFDRALAIRPNYSDALYNRGNALASLKRLDEALASYDRALAIKPDYAEAFDKRGRILTDLNRLDDALASYDRLIALKPDHPEALNDRGNILMLLNRLDEAVASYDRALAIQPDYADALCNRGLARLLSGDFRKGFEGYEWRWQMKGFSSKRSNIAAPNWRGEDLAGRSILVFSEQGLGDQIQFARYLPLLLDRGAKVTFFCPALLVRLIRSVDARIDFVSSLAGDEIFDVQCALMSLPRHFGTDLGSIPDRIPYVKPEPDIARMWKQRIGEAGFKIGIAWQGNPGGKIDRGRSFTLSALSPLVPRPGIRLISLQKNHGLDQLSRLPPGVVVERFGEEFDGGTDAFIDTAAVMSNLDLIITSDTSIAHLAGALGRPTWVALQHVPDWRWLLGRSDSPWYPTVRLFRQRTRGEWNTVFREMGDALDAYAASGRAN